MNLFASTPPPSPMLRSNDHSFLLASAPREADMEADADDGMSRAAGHALAEDVGCAEEEDVAESYDEMVKRQAESRWERPLSVAWVLVYIARDGFLKTDFNCYSRLCWHKNWFADLNWHVSVCK